MARGKGMLDIGPYLEEFVNKDACLIHHGKVERAPVLKEGEIKELVVNREVVIRCKIIG